MKTFFRVSILGLLMFAMVGATSQIAFAQDDEKTQIYNQYLNNYAGDLAQREIAVTAGKEFIEKYGADPLNKDIIAYLRENIPILEEGIVEEKKQIAIDEEKKRKAAASAKRLGDFDTAYDSGDIAKTFRTGQIILDAEPKMVDVAIVLAGVGYSQAVKKNDQFNDEGLKYAKLSIDLLENNSIKTTFGEWGGYDYVFKTEANPDGRDNALGFMNYYIGYIMKYRQQKNEESVPYFFKATKYTSGASKIPDTYGAIGSWYITKIQNLTNERRTLLEARNAETEVEKPDAEKIAMMDAQIDGKIALEKGYADRAIDAYSRAFGNLAEKDRTGEYGKSLFARLQALHKLRYHDKPEMQSDTTINSNVAMVKTKVMPDPSTDVQPVGIVKPVDTKTETKDATTGASRSRTVINGSTSN